MYRLKTFEELIEEGGYMYDGHSVVPLNGCIRYTSEMANGVCFSQEELQAIVDIGTCTLRGYTWAPYMVKLVGDKTRTDRLGDRLRKATKDANESELIKAIAVIEKQLIETASSGLCRDTFVIGKEHEQRIKGFLDKEGIQVTRIGLVDDHFLDIEVTW